MGRKLKVVLARCAVPAAPKKHLKNRSEPEESEDCGDPQKNPRTSRKSLNNEAFKSLVAGITEHSASLMQATASNADFRNVIFSPLSSALLITVANEAQKEQLGEAWAKDFLGFEGGDGGDSFRKMEAFKEVLESCPLGHYHSIHFEIQNEMTLPNDLSVSQNLRKVLKSLDFEINRDDSSPEVSGCGTTCTMNFHGDWHPAISFDSDFTRLEPFQLSCSKRIPVQMMQTSSPQLIEYADLREIDAQAISLRYDHPSLTLVIILPKDKKSGWEGLKALEDKISLINLTPEDLHSRFAESTSSRVYVKLPRFQIHSTIDLGKIAEEKESESKSDEGMEKSSQRVRMNLIHKAIIEVDEGVPKKVSCLKRLPKEPSSRKGHSRPVSFTADRPFIFHVVDKENNSFLMSGRVFDPTISPSSSSSATVPKTECPKSPECPKCPKSPECPKCPKSPESPKCPKSPESSKSSESPKSPESSKAPESLNSPESPVDAAESSSLESPQSSKCSSNISLLSNISFVSN